MKTTHLSGLLTTAGLVFGGGSSYAQQRPNILWLTIEDTSPYDFGCYGNGHVATPTIDSLAGAGIQYMRVHSVGTQNSPSRSCIITGCYASTFGMEWHRCRFATPETVFLPDYMRAAGYYCTNKSKTDYNTLCDNKAMWDSCGPAATYNNPARKKDQPFFAVFNSMATHMGRIRSYHTDQRRDFALEGLDPARLELPPHVPDIPEIRSDFAFHMEGSQDIDAWVRMFLDDLRRQRLDENTIVFFFSDHGGCLPRGKGFVYETGTHVPFIVYLPPKWRHLANGQSGRTDRLIGFPDLAPTVLSLAGIEPPAYMQGKAFLGEYEAAPKRYEFAVKANQASHYCPERAVTDGRYKYIVRYIPYKHDALMNAYQWGMPGNICWDETYLGGRCRSAVCPMTFERHCAELFFDLAEDPYEIDNRMDDPACAEEIRRLRSEMSRFLRDTGDLGFFLKAQRLTPTPLCEKLRDEGYDYERLYRLAELTSKVTPESLPYLTECLASPRKEIRYWAVVNINQLAATGQIAKVPEAFAGLLGTDDPEIAAEAAYAMCLTGRSQEAMAYLTAAGPNGRLDSHKLTMLELLTLAPDAGSYFTEDVRRTVRAVVAADPRQTAVSETGEGEYFIAARKILVNLRELPAAALWGEHFYEEGVEVNRNRRKMVPTPFVNR